MEKHLSDEESTSGQVFFSYCCIYCGEFNPSALSSVRGDDDPLNLKRDS